MCETGRRDETNVEEIKITQAMVDAASEVLWRHSTLDITMSLAENLAREILKRALLASRESPLQLPQPC